MLTTRNVPATRSASFVLLGVLLISVPVWPQTGGTAAELAQQAVEAVKAGDYQAAVEDFRSALELAPDLHQARFQLGRVLATQGQFESAAEEFRLVVEARPEDGLARRGEVTALLLMGRYADARRRLEEGLIALPRDGQLAHTLARLLAVAPVEDIRDGQLAVQLATAVSEVVKLFETGETLAMAYAEAGDFDRAIELQRSLVSRAEKAGDTVRAQSLRLRLLSYQRGEPWRASDPAEIALATQPPEPGRPAAVPR